MGVGFGGALDGACEVVGGGVVEERAGFGVDDGVEGAPGAAGDDGGVARLGFDGGDAEVFDLWVEEDAGAAHVVDESFVVGVVVEGDVGVGARVGAQCSSCGPGPDDVEGDVQRGAGVDGEVDAFVGFEGADDEGAVGSFDAGVWAEAVGADGGVDDDGVSVVDGSDLGRDVVGVGDEPGDVCGGALVPFAEGVPEVVEPCGAESVFEGVADGVVVAAFPEVAGGGVAVAEVGDGRGGLEPFDGAGGCGDEEVDGGVLVVGGESLGELGDGFGVRGEEPAAEWCGEEVERGGGDGEGVDCGCDGSGGAEHGVAAGDGGAAGEEVGRDGVEDEFAAASCDEPIVGEGDAQPGVGAAEGSGVGSGF